MERALRLARTLGQWFSFAGIILIGFGLAGWILALFHRSSSLLIDLGVLALPLFFLGLVFFLTAAVLEWTIAQRRSPKA